MNPFRFLARPATVAGPAQPALGQARPRRPGRAGLPAALTLLALCHPAAAQTPAPAPHHAASAGAAVSAPPTPAAWGLRQLFDAAWARQPEAQALAARREVAQAQQQAARAWTPAPPAVEVAGSRDNGARYPSELQLAVALPLWLPGERGGSQALATAERLAVESQASAAQLRLAATLREAWWAAQTAQLDVASAAAQLDLLRRLADDVARRTREGDLARADQFQAEAAVAGAQAQLAQADAELATALAPLHALAGPLESLRDLAAHHQPETRPDPAPPPAHATLQDLQQRVQVAQQAATLADRQRRAHPELTLSSTRERGAAGVAPQQTWTLGLRWAFGDGPRHAARVAQARADASALQAEWALERDRLLAAQQAARSRVDSAEQHRAAAQRRADLAAQTRGFIDKAFQWGQADLPTRLRVEAEASEAQRQAQRAQLALAAAISAWRQALGLLPE
jgi:cobalt-zinc-cadmium efflux system outer membrane protein